jgi:hypothetical protein
MTKPPVKKVKELHVRVRGKGKDHSSILSHSNPAGQGSSRQVTWHTRVLDAEKGPRELTELMPLDEPVQLCMICMLTDRASSCQSNMQEGRQGKAREMNTCSVNFTVNFSCTCWKVGFRAA